MVYTITLPLLFHDCDLSQQMKLSTALGWAGDVASLDYASRGLTHRALAEMGFVVLLAGYTLRVLRPPHAEERLTLTTWERGAAGAYVLRDCRFVDGDGRDCLYVSSRWFYADTHTRKPVRPDRFPPGVQSDPRVLDCPAWDKHRPDPAALCPMGSHRVVLSDLDGNRHVTNSRYADIASDCLPEGYAARSLTSFTIRYIHEARLGDTLSLSGCPDGEGYLVCGRLSGKDAFVCRFGFGAKDGRKVL